MEKLTVFLDIDGVLNAKTSWTTPFQLNETVQLQELRAKFDSFGLAINGRTKDLQNRMQEIDEYIRVHDIKIYAIFDDDPNEYNSEYLKKVSLINSDTGFTASQSKNVKWIKVRK